MHFGVIVLIALIVLASIGARNGLARRGRAGLPGPDRCDLVAPALGGQPNTGSLISRRPACSDLCPIEIAMKLIVRKHVFITP